MRKNDKGKWSIFIITVFCVGMIYFFSSLKQNAGFAINMNQNAAFSSEEEGSYEDSGYYVNTSGVEYQLDSYGVSEAEKETEASTETEKKRNGGMLLPGSKDNGTSSSSGTTGAKKSTSATTEFDPDDHDIDGYYEDNKDIFDSYDEAYDAFEDDEDAWDDY